MPRNCQFQGCKTTANFGIQGKKTTHCSKHRQPEMIDLINIRCEVENCLIHPAYGFPGKKRVRCATHKLENMIDVKNRRCEVENCLFYPAYGFPEKKAVRCATHRLENMINVKSRRCKFYDEYMCHSLAYITHESQYYCTRCFVHTFPHIQKTKRIKAKETHIAEFIKTQFDSIPEAEEIKIQFDKKIGGGCSRRRPDILISTPYLNLIIEVDEFQHIGYDNNCEMARLNNIYQDLECMPLVMIRFNPDQYLSNGVKVKSCFKDGVTTKAKKNSHKYESIENRLQVLMQTIQKWMKYMPVQQIEYNQIDLFYNDYID